MPFVRDGYGQVEPNQLSAQKTGQIYASLPLDTNVDVLQNGEFMYYDQASGKVTATDSTGLAEPMLVFNEIKLYEPFWRTTYKDFAMIRVNHIDNSTTPATVVKGENYVTSGLATQGYGDGADNVGVVPSTTNPPSAANSTGHTEYPYRMDGFAPRLFKTNVGDIFTTNMVTTGAGVTYTVGALLGLVKTDRGTLQLELVDSDPQTTQVLVSDIRFIVAKVYTMPDGQDGLQIQRVQ